MTFLIQIPQLIYAGAEKVLVCFANELVAHGHQVEILESYDRGFLKPQFDSRVQFHCICSNEYTSKYYCSLAEVRTEKNLIRKVVKLGKLVFSKLVGYRRFAERLAAKHYAGRQFDVAINYLEIESPKFLREHIYAKKYIQWYHTDIANVEDPEKTDCMIGEYAKMDAIICVAKSARNSFVERYPSLAGKTHVIYNFFDSAAIKKRSEEPFRYPDADRGCSILLSVGRLTPPKKYIRFLRVLSRLKREGFEFCWHVLGDGGDRPEMERMILTSGLEDCVYLEGLTDNPYPYMAHCDLFVLPSGWEGFPTVTVEAKLLGCPVLATDVSGIREQLIHGETGWIVDNDEKSIYQGLRYLLENTAILESLRCNRGMDAVFDNRAKYDKLMQIIGESDS